MVKCTSTGQSRTCSKPLLARRARLHQHECAHGNELHEARGGMQVGLNRTFEFLDRKRPECRSGCWWGRGVLRLLRGYLDAEGYVKAGQPG